MSDSSTASIVDREEPDVIEGWFGLNPDESTEQSYDDLHAMLAHARKEAPVHRTPAGHWRLMRYGDVQRLLREVPCGVRLTNGRLPGRIDNEGTSGGFMLQQDPPAHTRLRNLVSRAFTPRATRAWRPRTQEIVDELVDSALERGSIDVIADLALPVPATVICEMLGVPVEDRDRFTHWTGEATFALAGDAVGPEALARAQGAALELAAYFNALIAERRGALGDDLISELIRAEEAGDRLSPDELLIQSIGLLIAGFETTIGLIGNGIRQLVMHPGELARLRAEPELIESAVEECLRFDGPITLTPRVLHAEAEFGGFRIPKDVEVWAMLASANRDPERFPDPDRFDIGRRDNAHVAFGGGAHLCLGTHLARMEAQLAIGSFVARTSAISLASEEVEWGKSLFRVPSSLAATVRPA